MKFILALIGGFAYGIGMSYFVYFASGTGAIIIAVIVVAIILQALLERKSGKDKKND